MPKTQEPNSDCRPIVSFVIKVYNERDLLSLDILGPRLTYSTIGIEVDRPDYHETNQAQPARFPSVALRNFRCQLHLIEI